MASPGLRERKKARTRRLIADTAARLFAERGYEHVAVTDVAREAEVAEQTVYNYFPTKEQLVTDREQQIQDRLCDLIRSRPPGVTPAAAVRDFVLGSVAGIRSIPADLWRGELGYLAAISPAVHRLVLELALLTRGPRDLPERQQTLRAAIAWSYDLLAAAEQRLFRQLGVFVGGFTLQAVEALVEAGPDDVDPLEAISGLVGQSLVFVEPLDETTPRYRMLETIREFAIEQLDASGEAGETRRRHAEFFRDLAERAEPMLLGTPERRTWNAQLERDHDNVRAALAWSMSADGVLAVGVALAGALGWFWLMSGRLQEAESWYARLLARRDEADDSLAWAKVLHGSALQLWALGDVAQAAPLEESAVRIFRSAGASRWLSYGLALLAQVRTGQGKLDQARALLEEARAVWTGVETTYGQPFDAYLRYYLGSAALVQGDADTAGVYLESSLHDLEAAGDDLARGVVLGSLGLLAAQRGEHAEAQARFAEGLPLLRQGGDLWDLALLLLNSGLEQAGGGRGVACRGAAYLAAASRHRRRGIRARRAGRGRGRPRAASPRWPAARRGPGPAPGG